MCVFAQWNLLARKAIPMVWDSITEMGFEVGICIEAEGDEEMPEQMLACAQFNKPSWDAATDV